MPDGEGAVATQADGEGAVATQANGGAPWDVGGAFVVAHQRTGQTDNIMTMNYAKFAVDNHCSYCL